MAKKVLKLTESDLNNLIGRIIKESQPELTGNPSPTIPAEKFIEMLYSIADKYGKMQITLSFDGKYVVGTETNSRQKFKITIT